MQTIIYRGCFFYNFKDLIIIKIIVDCELKAGVIMVENVEHLNPQCANIHLYPECQATLMLIGLHAQLDRISQRNGRQISNIVTR